MPTVDVPVTFVVHRPDAKGNPLRVCATSGNWSITWSIEQINRLLGRKGVQ